MNTICQNSLFSSPQHVQLGSVAAISVENVGSGHTACWLYSAVCSKPKHVHALQTVFFGKPKTDLHVATSLRPGILSSQKARTRNRSANSFLSSDRSEFCGRNSTRGSKATSRTICCHRKFARIQSTPLACISLLRWVSQSRALHKREE